MKKQLESPDCHFYFIQKDDLDAGVIRLNRQSDNNFEVSVFIAPEFYGLGLATKALKMVRLLHPDLNLLAYVMPANKASIKLFQKAGYSNHKDDWFISHATI